MYGLKFRGQYTEPIAKEFDGLLSALRAWLSVDHNEDGTHNLRPSGFDFVPIGAIQMWVSETAPERWLICNGDAVSRTTYQGLFAVIGTTYGAGDTSTTFNLPDLRQRFPLGKAASGTGSTLGSTGGAIDHTHSGGSHVHAINSDGGHSHTFSGAVAASPASAFETFELFTSTGADGASKNHAHDVTGSTTSDGAHTHGGSTGASSGSTGSGNPPYVTVHYIILAGA